MEIDAAIQHERAVNLISAQVTGAEETKYNESFRYGGASVATGAAGGATVASARSARSGRSRGGRSTGSHNMDMDMSDDDSSYNMA